MDESLMERRRVGDDAFRSVKPCCVGRTVGNFSALTVPHQKATANSVPAAAVIRGWQALFGITGRKGCVGGKISQV